MVYQDVDFIKFIVTTNSFAPVKLLVRPLVCVLQSVTKLGPQAANHFLSRVCWQSKVGQFLVLSYL